MKNLFESFNFDGVSFVSIKGYSSDKSENTEVADVLINVGVSYGNAKEKDLQTLKSADVDLLTIACRDFSREVIEQAVQEKIKSIESPSENRSKGQQDAYIFLNEQKTLKYCPNTNSVLIFAMRVRKTVIKEGVYKEVKSKELTLAKRAVDRVLDLRCAKFKQYKLSNITAIKTSGDTIEFK